MLIIVADEVPDPDPPVYREGYPEFDLAEAARRRALSDVSVTWRNQYNHAVGSSNPVWHGDFKIVAGYKINLIAYIGVSTAVLVVPVTWILRGKFWVASTNSRSCGNVVTRLYLASVDWLCATCQGLGHRRNVMSKAAARSERWAELQAEVGEGRPSGMSDKTFLAKRLMMRELRAKLGGTPVRASPRHQAIIYADWSPDPAREIVHEKAEPPRRFVRPGFSDVC